VFAIYQFRFELLPRGHNISRECSYNWRRVLPYEECANGKKRGLSKTSAFKVAVLGAGSCGHGILCGRLPFLMLSAMLPNGARWVGL